jgi:hypothetical protein
MLGKKKCDVYYKYMKHTHVLREIAKIFTGLIIADISVGLWVGFGHGYSSIFLGIPLSPGFIDAWILFDVALLLLLIHYAWHIRIPPSKSKKSILRSIGVLLGLVAILHFVRIIFGTSVIIGDFRAPLWLSLLGALVTGFLSYASFHFASKKI